MFRIFKTLSWGRESSIFFTSKITPKYWNFWRGTSSDFSRFILKPRASSRFIRVWPCFDDNSFVSAKIIQSSRKNEHLMFWICKCFLIGFISAPLFRPLFILTTPLIFAKTTFTHKIRPSEVAAILPLVWYHSRTIDSETKLTPMKQQQRRHRQYCWGKLGWEPVGS